MNDQKHPIEQYVVRLNHRRLESYLTDTVSRLYRTVPLLTSKAYYQAFFRVLIDLIVELLGLIIKPFDNQTES
jgi:hypothetical protein